MNLDENSEHHASDLEWMLRSQQVDDEIMVERLLDEIYADIYQLVLSRLEYPELAAQDCAASGYLHHGKYEFWSTNIDSEEISSSTIQDNFSWGASSAQIRLKVGLQISPSACRDWNPALTRINPLNNNDTRTLAFQISNLKELFPVPAEHSKYGIRKAHH